MTASVATGAEAVYANSSKVVFLEVRDAAVCRSAQVANHGWHQSFTT